MTLAHQYYEPCGRQTSQDDYVFLTKTEFSESFCNFSSHLSVVFISVRFRMIMVFQG